MNSTWDEKLPVGLRFMVTKTTKGRIGLIIGQHKFRKSGAQKDGSLIFRCSLKDCPARVNLDAPMRRLLRIRSHHNHPGRDLSDIISARLPAGLRSAEGPLIKEEKDEEISGGSKRFPGVEKVMPFHSLEMQMERRRRFQNSFDETSGMVMMESHVERFLEQRLEQFADHGMDNHFDQLPDHHNQGNLPRCEVTMNNQGGDKLHFNGYSYSKKAISANAIRWTCATPTRSDTRCKGAITTDRERPYHNPRSLVEHNHPPEDSEANIMRDIARAKRRMRRRTYPHPFQFYPWMLPLQQMQEHGGGDPNSLEATLGMGMGGGMIDPAEAGPSGYGDDVRVKMEPEWVDAGALEPNCELEGQYDDNQDYNSSYADDSMSARPDDQNYHHLYSGDRQSQQQQPQQSRQQSGQLPLVPDSQEPVKLRVPGKPNLTITVAPTRQGQGPSQSNPPPAGPPPLHLINPLLKRPRGRPRGSNYGTYSEMDDRVTTILTDSIIANQKLEKMGAAAHYTTPIAAFDPMSRVKPRSRDPEAVKAAELVNTATNRAGPSGVGFNEELEKVRLKLRQQVLALEVQNIKAERDKLIAYRRNVAIRQEIMMLHLKLGKGIPSECASSGRGLETVDVSDSYTDNEMDNDYSNSVSHDEVTVSKKLPQVSISRSQSNQSPKISVRKSLQTANQSPNVSPLSSSSSTKCATPPPGNVNKPVKEKSGKGNRLLGDHRESSESTLMTNNSQSSENKDFSDDSNIRQLLHNTDLSVSRLSNNGQQSDQKHLADSQQDVQGNDYKGIESEERLKQSATSDDHNKDELVPLDSVSSDLSVEMLSEPGSSQWTNQSSAPMTEHEGFDDLQFDGEDSYDNSEGLGEFSGAPVANKEPADTRYGHYPDGNPQKRRRVDNMWEPDDGSL